MSTFQKQKVWTRQVRSLLLWTFFSQWHCVVDASITWQSREGVGFIVTYMGEPSQCLWENRSLTHLFCTGRMLQFTTNGICCIIVQLHSSIRSRNIQMLNQYPMYCPFRFYSAPVWTPLVASHACGRVDTLHAIVAVALLSQVKLKWSSKRGSFYCGTAWPATAQSSGAQ